jgi:hypothetical protein
VPAIELFSGAPPPKPFAPFSCAERAAAVERAAPAARAAAANPAPPPDPGPLPQIAAACDLIRGLQLRDFPSELAAAIPNPVLERHYEVIEVT